MPYAFEADESLPDAIRRVMDEQIVRARTQLTDLGTPIEKRVHDARKRFKETRALLRLVRKPLGAEFAVENASYRDLARELAAARDADAVLEALEKLEGVPRALLQRTKKKLRADRQQHPPLEPVIERVLEQLLLAQARIALWPSMADSFDTIATGLQRTYREGRRAAKSARTPEELHEWRKRVKEHWYHAQLLRHLWPGMMKAYAAVLEDLSHALGDHHDLHVLRGLVDAPVLIDLIEKRQAELEKLAQSIASRAYAEPASAWLARMRKYFAAWKA